MVKEVDGTNNQVYGAAVTKQLRCLARDALARRGDRHSHLPWVLVAFKKPMLNLHRHSKAYFLL